jgi:hypothetical protein
LTQRLSRCPEQTLQVGDGGRSLLAFDAERLVMADGFRPGAGGFLLDGRRERASGAYLAFRLGLDEGRPLDFECLPGDLDCMVEPDVPGLRVKESLPEEPVAPSGCWE